MTQGGVTRISEAGLPGRRPGGPQSRRVVYPSWWTFLGFLADMAPPPPLDCSPPRLDLDASEALLLTFLESINGPGHSLLCSHFCHLEKSLFLRNVRHVLCTQFTQEGRNYCGLSRVGLKFGRRFLQHAVNVYLRPFPL